MPESYTEHGRLNSVEAAVRNGGRNLITQSIYFNPRFNSAVFDGPLRLYFSQSEEALALRIYLELRNSLGELRETWKSRLSSPMEGGCVFLMMYSTIDERAQAFSNKDSSQKVLRARVGGDTVFGIVSSQVEENLSTLVEALRGEFAAAVSCA